MCSAPSYSGSNLKAGLSLIVTGIQELPEHQVSVPNGVTYPSQHREWGGKRIKPFSQSHSVCSKMQGSPHAVGDFRAFWGRGPEHHLKFPKYQASAPTTTVFSSCPLVLLLPGRYQDLKSGVSTSYTGTSSALCKSLHGGNKGSFRFTQMHQRLQSAVS